MPVVRGVAAVFGVLALAWPGPTLVALIALFAAYAIVSGAVAILAAVRNRDQRGWWLPLLLGMVFGWFVVLFPDAGALALLWIIGAYAIAVGIALVILGVRMRKAGGPPAARPAGASA
jgi:uncharacterized membrane protein HdeD (DUF308 family)